MVIIFKGLHMNNDMAFYFKLLNTNMREKKGTFFPPSLKFWVFLIVYH